MLSLHARLFRLRFIAGSILLLSALIGYAPVALQAQSAAAAGQIVGQVTDPSSGSVTGVEVTVRNVNTNYKRTATTDSEGRYAIPELPLGPYEVTASATGFAAETQQVFVSLGSSVTTAFHLTVEPQSQNLEVNSDNPGIEPTRTATKSILTDLQIHNLPSDGRRLQNFVVDTPQALIEPECRGFSISGQKGIYSFISIDGGDYDSTWGCGIRARSESAPTFSLEAIQELQVVRNTFSAEFGRSTGGVIQLSTKSGTNQFHGTAYELNRDGALAADDALGHQVVAQENQFGGSLGGPIVADNTFFFIAPEFQIGHKPVQVLYPLLDEENIRYLPGTTTLTPEASGLLSAAPEGPFSAVSDSQSVISRIDHKFSNTNQFFGRFDFTRALQTTAAGADGLSTSLGIQSGTTNSAFSTQVTQPDANYTLLGQLTSSLSNTHLNELRFQFSREVRPRINLGQGPQVTVSNTANGFSGAVATYGTPPAGSWGNEGFASTDNRYELVENFSIVSGAHTLKFGVDYQRIAGWALYNQSAGGVYAFSSLDNLLNRNPTTYSQSTGAGSINLTIHEIAGYVQDEWRIRPGLTINPGFRYEAQVNPNYFSATAPANRYPGASSIPDDLKMFAPRLGVAWDVNNSGKTVVRAGGGLYYAPTYMSMIANSILFNGGNPNLGLAAVTISNTATNPNAIQNAFQSIGVNLAAAPLGNLPVFTPSQFAALQSAANVLAPPSVFYMDPNFRNPVALQWQAGVEHEIARGISISEGFTYINTNDIARELDTNLGVPVPDATGRNIYNTPGHPRPNPAFGQAIATQSADHSLYRGFTTTLNIRRSRYTFDAYYTRSWNLTSEDAERGFTSIRYADVNDLPSEYNHSNIDEPNQFWTNGVYFLPAGFELGFTTTLWSGRPSNALASTTDINGDGVATDRPIINGVMMKRNAFRNTGFKDVSLRVQKNFPLPIEKGTISISAEFFNAFNFANAQMAGASLIYGLGATPLAGFDQLKNAQGQLLQTDTVADPFQAQLGLRFQF